jgi:formiminoglutamate deiminase
MSRQTLQADLAWVDGGFVPNIVIAVGADGRIASVGRDERPTRRLEGMALLPGFVNAHSHAFQRGLRGSGERFPTGGGSFWSWRQAMYGLVSTLDRATLARICRLAFAEMRDAGITTVGEFHYLHHDRDDDFAFDKVVLAAAADVGIRLTLIQAYYATGGVGKPLEPGQVRFATRDLDRYWRQLDQLAAGLPPTQTLAVAAHSVRAAGIDEIVALHAEAGRRKLPFHLHLEEQRQEIADTLAAYGRTPARLLCEELKGGAELTAVHCTHTSPSDMAALLARGWKACICPLTEANLGDGLPELSALHETGGRIALGTDSNARISVLEDMRWLEYGQRLRRELRGALTDVDGGVAATVLAAATTGGAASLGVEAGTIAPGAWADFVAIDLSAPALAEVPESGLLDAIVFGTDNGVIEGTFVGGVWRPSN